MAKKTSRTNRTRNVSGRVRTYSNQSWLKKNKKVRSAKRKAKSKKFKRFIYVSFLGVVILCFLGLIGSLVYVQSLTEDLPSPDQPFGPKNSASEIYDRNGKLLYRVFADQNADPVNIEEVPPLLKWSFLAAEDADFYSHPGVDVPGIIRCSFQYVRQQEIACGASTITQQMIKQTSLTNERKVQRKIKEVILALQIEREREKDEILEMYLTIAPEGSNVYGVTSAAKFYFDKDLNELNLAEMAILASIPQDPTRLSPTKSANPKDAQERVKTRQEYVLDQMEKNLDKINESIKEETGEENVLTLEMIQEARDFELKYKEPKFDIKAPHFVFYTQKLLQERDYNNGEPFTLGELETQGYKIYTTLDSDYQQIAEEQVKKGVDTYGAQFGASNAALVSTNPKNGEILAMVGSYDYFGKASPEGCTVGVDCRFEPSVNITDTLQSYGSSMKSMVYYKAIMDKIITPGSILADVPIEIGAYKPKNYEGGFIGLHPARKHLVDSRNIPAIELVEAIGIQDFVDEMKKWGYTTFDNPNGYGPAVSIGGADIKLVDHAQAYGVLANEGKLTQVEAVLKIENRDGEVIFKHEAKPEEVADPRGVFLVNDMLNGNKGGPGVSWDGRDVAGKTGTSEGQRETLFATYTPEIVAVGWLGNNNNEGMRFGASGLTSAKPWVSEYLQRVGETLPKTAFPRPGGIEFSFNNCKTEEENGCEGVNGDLAITEFKVPAYVQYKEVEVCKDQKDKLAREIDIALGRSVKVFGAEYKMTVESLQPFLDAYIESSDKIQSIPTEYCDVTRNPNGSNKPWAVISSPKNNSVLSDNKVTINYKAYSPEGEVDRVEFFFDNTSLGKSNKASGKETFSIGSPSPGSHNISVKVFDKSGKNGTSSVKVTVLGALSITSPSSGSEVEKGDFVDVSFTYSGGSLDSRNLIVDGKNVTACSNTKCTWNVQSDEGEVEVYVQAKKGGQTIQSNKITIKVKDSSPIPTLP